MIVALRGSSPIRQIVGSTREVDACNRPRVRALAETSAALMSVDRSHASVLEAMAERLSRAVEGGCLIRPRPGLADMRVTLAVGHARAESRRKLVALTRTSPHALGSRYCAQVVASGVSILTSEVSRKSLRLWTDSAAWPYLDQCAIFTFMVVPLCAGRRVLGTLTLWRETSGSGAPLDADDRVFAEEVGRRLIAA